MRDKTILFLLDNPYCNDRRVQREATSLVKYGYNVVVIATGKEGVAKEELIDGVRIIRLLDNRIFDMKKRGILSQFGKVIESLKLDFEVIHAHDQTMLALGVELKKNNKKRKLIYDSHELFSSWPLNLSSYSSISIFIKSYIVRQIQIKREKRNSKYIDFLITVNKSLSDYLTSYFKLGDKCIVIRNMPEVSNGQERDGTILRDIFNIPKENKILVFIGANIYARTLNLEQVLNEFGNIEKTSLIFITSLNTNALPIQEMVRNNGYANVFFHDLIEPDKIPLFLSSADVGLVSTWNKKKLSYWYALDNKLFEYINAELPVLATKQPEYQLVIEGSNCGVCVDPDEQGAYLKGFNSILAKYDFYKNATMSAKSKLNWEQEEKVLVQFYQRFFEKYGQN